MNKRTILSNEVLYNVASKCQNSTIFKLRLVARKMPRIVGLIKSFTLKINANKYSFDVFDARMYNIFPLLESLTIVAVNGDSQTNNFSIPKQLAKECCWPPQLTHLEIDAPLVDIHSNLFSNLHSLTLSKVRHLSIDFFMHLPQNNALKLSLPMMVEVTDDTPLSSRPDERNKLIETTISQKHVTHFNAMRWKTLDHGNIHFLPKSITILNLAEALALNDRCGPYLPKNIVSLDLGKNRIITNDFIKSLAAYENLQYLDISSASSVNIFSLIHFANFKSIQKILLPVQMRRDLQTNHLHFLPPSLLHLNLVESPKINCIPIDLPQSITKLKLALVNDFSQTAIRSLPKCITHLTLARCRIEFNELVNLLQELDQLIYINIKCCSVSYNRQIFDDLKREWRHVTFV